MDTVVYYTLKAALENAYKFIGEELPAIVDEDLGDYAYSVYEQLEDALHHLKLVELNNNIIQRSKQ